MRDKKGHFVKKTIAQKVRDLDAKGMPRAEIAKTLGIRYQRVRNVLVPRVKPVEVEMTETSESEATSVASAETQETAESTEPTSEDLEAIEELVSVS